MTWLERLKKLDLPGTGTDKTDRTPNKPLLSVLAVPNPRTFENARPVAARLRVVEFRLKVDEPGRWHTALGPDADDLIADLRDRYRDRLYGIRKPGDPEPGR